MNIILTQEEMAVVHEMVRRRTQGDPTVIDLDTLDRRQEKLALIRAFRNETQSKAMYDRCVAIIGSD